MSGLLLFMTVNGHARAQERFIWGNTTYANLHIGDTLAFEGSVVELISVRNHWNQLRIDEDTLWLKVSYRSPAFQKGNLKLFIASNRNVKALAENGLQHGLLTGDALVALCKATEPLLDPYRFSFPVSFSGGYIWKNNEDSYMFSYKGAVSGAGSRVFAGIALDMPGARGSARFPVLAMESGRVAWVETLLPGSYQPKASLCIESNSSPGIYYVYSNLFDKYVFVNRNQKIETGDPLGYIWGEGNWENLHLAVVRSDGPPDPATAHDNLVNFFPQLLELYYGGQPVAKLYFTKGQLYFGRAAGAQGNEKNLSAFEDHLGTGWNLGKWNTADKVEGVFSRQGSNARLSKTLFEGEPAQCSNPDGWYDFDISVRTGIYRIRARVGDCLAPSWQQVEFEGVASGTYILKAGESVWTPERIVRVDDGKLTIRIRTGKAHEIAGIAELVFQMAG